MSFLLKIVQGPQYGAEIALVEGINLSVGRADDCDIVINDASVAEKAFELEVTSERVVAILPGGKDIKFEPFHVVTIGTTSFVVGPAEGPWKDLVWPEAEKTEDEEEAVEESSGKPLPPKKRRTGCLFLLIMLFILVSTAVFLYLKYPKASKEYLNKAVARVKSSYVSCKDKVGCEEPSPPIKKTLADVAGEYGFNIVDNGGSVSVKGDFKTRTERLEATAQAYAVHPGLSVDFTDVETLKNAADELLVLVAEGRLKTAMVEGRKVFLEGTAPSQAFLRRALEALSADVPKIIAVDCSRVSLGAAESKAVTNEVSDEASSRYRIPRVRAERSKVKVQETAHPEMPVAGILTVPYPCLVLSDGSRAMEGARFGEYIIEKIEPDCVKVRGSDGVFVWRP